MSSVEKDAESLSDEEFIDQFIDSIPPVEELRKRIAKNLHERDLLKRMLRLSQQKEKLLPKGASDG